VGLIKEKLAQLVARMGDEALAPSTTSVPRTNHWGSHLKDYLKTRALGPAARQASRAARMQATEALPSIASYAKVQSVKDRAVVSASTDAETARQLPSTLVLEEVGIAGQQLLSGAAAEPVAAVNGTHHTVAWAERPGEQHALAPACHSNKQQPQVCLPAYVLGHRTAWVPFKQQDFMQGFYAGLNHAYSVAGASKPFLCAAACLWKSCLALCLMGACLAAHMDQAITLQSHLTVTHARKQNVPMVFTLPHPSLHPVTGSCRSGGILRSRYQSNQGHRGISGAGGARGLRRW
jgi:hypothetical protein